MFGLFNREEPASCKEVCANKCKTEKAEDDALSARTEQRAKGILSQPQRNVNATPCQAKSVEMLNVSARFKRYQNALPAARAARDMNELSDQRGKPVTQPCLTRLPLDAAELNRELGIDPDSPNAIQPQDLEDRTTGYRAAIYRSEADGRLIVVPRDTNPQSLVDWKTNIENGAGRQTDQYKSISRLTRTLNKNGVNFDAAGYSKGGGLAQQAGLISPNSNVYVFNSAGLNNNSLEWAGQSSFDSLTSRTSAFSADGDFLTFMNETTDPAQQRINAEFLQTQLVGDNWGPSPMKIKFESPANMDPKSQAFIENRDSFFEELGALIDSNAVDFPPVRAATRETIPNSMGWTSRRLSADGDQPNLGKLKQHLMENIVGKDADHPGAMENQMELDRNAMLEFKESCG